MTLPTGPPPGGEAPGTREAHALAVLLLAAALGVGTALPLLGPGSAGLPPPTLVPLSGLPSPRPPGESDRPSLQALPPPGATPTRSPSVIVGGFDVNTAELETLQTLPGIGPALAARIVAYREEYGPFLAVEDLLQVPGIGPKRWGQIRPLVRVAEEP